MTGGYKTKGAYHSRQRENFDLLDNGDFACHTFGVSLNTKI
jgi:hypothetical protein